MELLPEEWYRGMGRGVLQVKGGCPFRGSRIYIGTDSNLLDGSCIDHM